MSKADRYHELIHTLEMQPHPEGGFYKQTYVSDISFHRTALPERFNGDRFGSSAIYFLLPANEFSAFHRIKSDELWHFYEGALLHIHVIQPDGAYMLLKLGNDLANGYAYQHVVKAGSWFAAETATDSGFSLVGCTVSPGFDFADFEMANREELMQLFPQNKDLIIRLCRDIAD